LFDGEDPDVVVRDAASFKRIIRFFGSRKGYRRKWRDNPETTINLPSGKSFRFNFDTGKATKP
jgi:hypothetical protein